jgi:hypothetical protein
MILDEEQQTQTADQGTGTYVSPLDGANCQEKISQAEALAVTQNHPNGGAIPEGGINSELAVKIKGMAWEKYISQWDGFWQDCFFTVEFREKSQGFKNEETNGSVTVRMSGLKELILYPDLIISGLKRSTTYIWQARCSAYYVRCAIPDNSNNSWKYSGGGRAIGRWFYGGEFTTSDPKWSTVEVSNVDVKLGSIKSGDKRALEKKGDGSYLETSTTQCDSQGRGNQCLEMEVTITGAPENTEHIRLSYKGTYTRLSVDRFTIDILAWQQGSAGWINLYDVVRGRNFNYNFSTEGLPPNTAKLYVGPNGTIKVKLFVLDYDETTPQELLSDLLHVEAYA